MRDDTGSKNAVQHLNLQMVLCKLNLLDGSGLDYITWLRSKKVAYVICLTALDQEINQVMGYEAGADDYRTKPFNLSVLLLQMLKLEK